MVINSDVVTEKFCEPNRISYLAKNNKIVLYGPTYPPTIPKYVKGALGFEKMPTPFAIV